ncbi:MAG: hypothetical protein OHK0029_00750 [Armatimonadaceae bacterium]
MYNLSVTFHAEENAQGPIVGTAAASSTVLTDGTLSTTIATFGRIQRVVVPAGQVVKVGETRTVVYSALDSDNNVLAITPGSGFVNLVDSTSTVPGDPSASVQGEQITGINPIRAIVTVRVDDAVSPATNITVSSDVAITVTPNPGDVSIQLSQQFTANVANDGPASVNGVTWSVKEGATAGTITPAGLFTATRNEGTFTIVARSNYDPNVVVETPVVVSSKVAVTVTPNPVPNPVSFKGGQQQFSASVSNVPEGQDAGVTWSVKEGATGGSITSEGLYTAPNQEGTFTVVATSIFDPRRSTEVQVPVQSLVGLTVTPTNPAAVSIRTGQVQFNANVTGVPTGGDTGVDWSIEETGNSGSITQAGLYTAGTVPGDYTVVATSRFDPRRQVRVTVPVRSFVNVAITPTNPAPISFNGGTVQLNATVTGVPVGQDAGVTWSIVGNNADHTVSNTGLFSAGATQGQFTVRATSNFDPAKFAEVTVTVTSLVVVNVTPDNPGPISINATQQFNVSVTGVPTGGTTAVTWTVRDANNNLVNGAIDSNGRFTAPATPGVYRVIATSQFDPTKSGQESITVQSGSQPIIIR